jgi:excisionase family DNA binding protein
MNIINNTNQSAPGMAAQVEPELLTKAETAQLLAVSIRTIDNMVRQQRIAYVKLTSKMIRFPRREILKNIRENLTVHAHGLERGIV